MTGQLPSEWRFTSAVEAPDGLRVECAITVPLASSYPDLLELGELADMATRRVVSGWQAAADRRRRDALEELQRRADGVPF